MHCFFVTLACFAGLFGVYCKEMCHCKNWTECCQATNGNCNYGCTNTYTCEGLSFIRDSAMKHEMRESITRELLAVCIVHSVHKWSVWRRL